MARKLEIAFWNYDRTRLLAEGVVKIENADAVFHTARIVPEIFEAMVRRRAYDVSELGMTYFLRTFDDEDRSSTFRDFVHCSFADAGRWRGGRGRHARHGRHPQTFTEAVSMKGRNLLLLGECGWWGGACCIAEVCRV